MDGLRAYCVLARPLRVMRLTWWTGRPRPGRWSEVVRQSQGRFGGLPPPQLSLELSSRHELQ